MRSRSHRRTAPAQEPRRRATAATELALLLPWLVIIFGATVDFSRVCRAYEVVTWAARDGAYYGSMSATNSTNTTGIQTAAQADAGDLNPLPTIASTTGSDTDSKGVSYNYVEVTATYTFTTLTQIPGIKHSYTLAHTVRMQVLP
jgi:Flp pilus assembly protein TadG